MMLEFSVLVAVLVGLVEVIKKAFKLSTRYAPLISVVLGALAMVFLGEDGLNLAGKIFQGIIAGLSASGLYSGTKAIKNN